MLALQQKTTARPGRSANERVQRRTPDHGQHADPAPERAGACACGGSCPRCQARSALTIGASGDAGERQADAAAEQVMRKPGRGHVPALAAAPGGSVTGGEPATPASVDAVLRSPGQALDGPTRDFFESGYGHDFSGVRVHADSAAAQSARQMDALAYTVGRDIVFDSGQLAPHTPEGRHLLAHELAHVVQQSAAGPAVARVQRRVRRENVTCQATGLTNPDLTGDEVVAALEAADTEAIGLAQVAEDALTTNLASVRGGAAPDAAFDTILQEELGLTLANPAHFPLVRQVAGRYRRVRETLESGYLRYMCRSGPTTKLVGCTAGDCVDTVAFTCPGNRLMVLCQAFWDEPGLRGLTLLHEPFHIWFDMAQHAPTALRRADALCYESFALRASGQVAAENCTAHTGG
ncbi:eCIS core domain-containing protein [Pseudoduganella albidiflava]|uniref:DUF4157 domain-containing protein n=1 Tax=Pseudoduganella albidiflava TaxID=321983 RepID=A0A411WYF5_9BURK|nr:DUF4157 domain-containing protein [Pseudoduganella albidiflava]QBI01722.1 DUF4157 domain-containing protein [Pseudoduganella albidiflava]GGY40187.1 hypothetical protein GCM10007387_22960 [Pseudoduganella albidiflava]